MTAEPIDELLDDLTLIESYVDFDGPRVFSCRSSNRQVYLALWAAEDSGTSTWLYSPISEKHLEEIRSGILPLRDAFEEPDGDTVLKVVLPVKGRRSVNPMPGYAIPDDWLPERDVHLDVAETMTFENLASSASRSVDRRGGLLVASQINSQVKRIRDDVKDLADTVKKLDVDELRSSATDFADRSRARATESYEDLVRKSEEIVASARDLKLEDVQKRAEKLVESLRKDARKNLQDVRKRAKDARGDVQKRADDVIGEARATVQRVTKRPAKRSTAKKAAVKKTAAKKAPAKKTAAKKALTKKTAAKNAVVKKARTRTAKKAPAKEA